jgi:cytochrome d ubiquinol oxidase subunit I
MGVIATRSLDKPVAGLRELMAEHEKRIRSGMLAYDSLLKIRGGDASPETKALLDAHAKDIGHGLLLKQFTENPAQASEEQVMAAVKTTIPTVWPLFSRCCANRSESCK